MDATLYDKLNGYVANLGVAYIKTHNLHWNVNGFAFKAVHEYLEGLYEAYTDSMDEAAEIIRQQGRVPASSMKEFLEIATIEDVPSREWGDAEAIRQARDDMAKLRQQALEAHEVCTEGDFVTAAFLEDQVAAFDKELWFMDSMLK